jgi:hypothetical protein
MYPFRLYFVDVGYRPDHVNFLSLFSVLLPLLFRFYYILDLYTNLNMASEPSFLGLNSPVTPPCAVKSFCL